MIDCSESMLILLHKAMVLDAQTLLNHLHQEQKSKHKTPPWWRSRAHVILWIIVIT
jgi:hypothetical protein